MTAPPSSRPSIPSNRPAGLASHAGSIKPPRRSREWKVSCRFPVSLPPSSLTHPRPPSHRPFGQCHCTSSSHITIARVPTPHVLAPRSLPGERNIVWLLSDGVQSDGECVSTSCWCYYFNTCTCCSYAPALGGDRAAIETSSTVKATGATLFAVGIGTASTQTLDMMASQPSVLVAPTPCPKPNPPPLHRPSCKTQASNAPGRLDAL